jgi:hypothetical protein
LADERRLGVTVQLGHRAHRVFRGRKRASAPENPLNSPIFQVWVFKNSVYLCLLMKTAGRPTETDRFLVYLSKRLRLGFHRLFQGNRGGTPLPHYRACQQQRIKRKTQMNWQFIEANLINFLINLLYALTALIIGVVAFRLIDHIFFNKIDFIEEIRKGNIAAAIYAGILLLFIAILLGASLRG